MTLSNRKARLAVLPATLALLAPAVFSSPVLARVRHTHRGNFMQRHPTMTGAAAGLATHHALKVSARHKKARGQRLNAAERHPTLTGLAAGVGTRHIIKKHTH